MHTKGKKVIIRLQDLYYSLVLKRDLHNETMSVKKQKQKKNKTLLAAYKSDSVIKNK